MQPKISYNFNNVQKGFMNNTDWSNCLRDMIFKIENNVNTETELSNWYTKFCEVICTEMNKFHVCKLGSYSVKNNLNTINHIGIRI